MKQKINTPAHLITLGVKTFFISIGVCILVVVSLLGLIGILLTVERIKDHKQEQIADAKLQQELAALPEIKVTYKVLWEGDVIVTAIIENKGKINFWYGKDSFSIQGINDKFVDFECFNLDKNGNRTTHAFVTGLYLRSNHPFKKWFPFEVNTLKELSEKYEQIVQIISTFPPKGSAPNAEFMFEREIKGKVYSCDLVRI